MKHNNNGFTLIETIIVISLLGVISFGLGSFIMTAMQSWVLISGRESAVNSGRVAMNRLVTEIKRVKKPQNMITYTSSICSFQDVDTQAVTFEQSSANLLRNGSILATGLLTPTGLLFTYLGSTGEVVTAKQNIRSVRVWLSLSAGGQRVTIESAARIRNL